MDKLAELIAWIALDFKLRKDTDITEFEAEDTQHKTSLPMPITIALISVPLILFVGFFILAFAV